MGKLSTNNEKLKEAEKKDIKFFSFKEISFVFLLSTTVLWIPSSDFYCSSMLCASFVRAHQI